MPPSPKTTCKREACAPIEGARDQYAVLTLTSAVLACPHQSANEGDTSSQGLDREREGRSESAHPAQRYVVTTGSSCAKYSSIMLRVRA